MVDSHTHRLRGDMFDVGQELPNDGDAFVWDATRDLIVPKALSAATLPTAALVPTGSILPFGGTAAPTGWLLCDGSSQLRAGALANLFAVIGVAFGSVDGSHFNLPDFRGRVGVGQGGGTAGVVGAVGGIENQTLTTANLPAHDHGGFVGDSGGFTAGVANIATAAGAIGVYQRAAASVLTIPTQGSGSAHNNMQPYVLVTHIIKT